MQALPAAESDRSVHEHWVRTWMRQHDIDVWGMADLRDVETVRDDTGLRFPYAIAWGVPMNPHVMADIRHGPNQAYADEYARANERINDLGQRLAAGLIRRGFRASPLAASARTDKTAIRGDFPHKTAATRAGLGWIGRHCQLVTRPYGPWVRLGTVFTDLTIRCGQPTHRSYCGRCFRCVEACPAKALSGATWTPGVARETILDAHACDKWKKDHYFAYHRGHNCGICSSVCPYGRKGLRKRMETE